MEIRIKLLKNQSKIVPGNNSNSIFCKNEYEVFPAQNRAVFTLKNPHFKYCKPNEDIAHGDLTDLSIPSNPINLK
jgi:hypothetical protein